MMPAPGTRVRTPLGEGVVSECLRCGWNVEASHVELDDGRRVMFFSRHVGVMTAEVIPFPRRPAARPCDTEPPEAA